MLSVHGNENTTEFVLHDLCNKDCLNIKKAAYFVDNPDFNCFKGVAGFNEAESYPDNKSWDKPEHFTQFMKQCPFNQSVRNINGTSPHLTATDKQEFMNNLAQKLSFSQPHYFTWDMKHNNHGMLIFESNNPEEEIEEDFVQTFCILGFCPIF
jgi:hypothetical protein